MNHTTILTLYAYNDWANQRLLAVTQSLSPELFSAAYPISHGSLRGTLVHTLGAERIWRQRCQEGLSPISMLAETDFTTLADLQASWQAEMDLRSSYLASLSDGDLLGTIRYRNTKGRSFERILWHILAHVVNHGTQHRSEAAMALTEYGASPGALDMITFFP
jgi:uncharacterized damage-inducible protein DinB